MMPAILLVLTLFVVIPIMIGHIIYVGSNEEPPPRIPGVIDTGEHGSWLSCK